MTYMSNFRRSVKADTRSKGKGGGGGKGSWREEMRLPQDPLPPAAFAFLKTEYPDQEPAKELQQLDPATGQFKPVMNLYFKGKRHRRKYYKNGVEAFAEEACSKGYDPYNPKPCVGCMAMESGDKTVTLSDYYAFGIYHLAYYHGHPIWDFRNNTFMTKDNSNEFIMGYDECVGRDCNYCRILKGQPAVQTGKYPFPSYQAQTITTVFGRRRFLKIGKGHLSNLEGWDSQVSSICGTCRNQMTVEGFDCPTCSSLLIDMEQDPRTTEQIVQAISSPISCPVCNRGVLVREVSYCQACEAAGRECAISSLTDVVSYGCRQGEGTNSNMMLKNFTSMEEFETNNPGIAQFLEGKSLRQFISEVKPYDFVELFKPRSLEDQAKRLELSIPGVTTPVHGGPAYASYGNSSGQTGVGPAGFVPPGRPNFGK